MHSVTRILSLFTLIAATSLAAADKPLKIHMLDGSVEYKSAISLPKLAETLKKQGHTCTIAKGVNDKADIANLENCDVLVVFCKRWKLQGKGLEAIKAAGTTKPIIGIRTASHAFQTWLAFDNDVMGGTYSGHGGGGEVTVTLENKDHPVLAGITEGWKRQGKIYDNPPKAAGKSGSPKAPFKADNVVLMRLDDKRKKPQPGTWVRQNPNGQRVFYTSLGFVHDFEDERFVRLLGNALTWVTEKK
jgi:type 1 glutamine amidotransferase